MADQEPAPAVGQVQPEMGQPEAEAAQNLAWRLTPARLPEFSGDSKHCSFDIWKYEVECLIKEKVPDTQVKSAIRRSVRGQAQKTLLILGTEATVSGILAKFKTAFGPTLSAQTVLANLYTMRQREGEDAGSFSSRLEDTVQQAIVLERVTRAEADVMLREAFQGGLAKDTKMATSYLLADSDLAFDQLALEVKRVEKELNLVGAGQVKSMRSEEAEVEKLREMVGKLRDRVAELEGKSSHERRQPVPTSDRGLNGSQSQGRGLRPTGPGSPVHGRWNRTQHNSFARGRGYQFAPGQQHPVRGQGTQHQVAVGNAGRSQDQRVCYNCLAPGHFARECPKGQGHLNGRQPGGRGLP